MNYFKTVFSLICIVLFILFNLFFLQEGQSLEESHVEHPEIANSSFAVQHALRKAELCKQLQELTNALAMKEEIASKMVDNERITSMRKQHEVSIAKIHLNTCTVYNVHVCMYVLL